MHSSRKASTQSSSVSDEHQSSDVVRNIKSKSSPISNFDYVGRLVTHERPITQKSRSSYRNLPFRSSKNHYHERLRPYTQEFYEEDLYSSDDDVENFSQPAGTIRINNRHSREIYRMPTPPSEIKRIYRRARSPEPKIIERIYVHRPAPEIIEKIIGIPPQKTQIINREKYLRKPKPIIRTKFVHLKPDDECVVEEQQQIISIPSEQYSSPTYVYSSQPTLRTTSSYTQSAIPSYVTYKSQQLINPQLVQASCYSYTMPSTLSYQYSQF